MKNRNSYLLDFVVPSPTRYASDASSPHLRLIVSLTELTQEEESQTLAKDSRDFELTAGQCDCACDC